MNTTIPFLSTLSQMGWDVRLREAQRSLPEAVRVRYPWLPVDITTIQESADVIVAPDARAWFLTSADFAGESDSAFAWNQWELDSLAAALNPNQQRRVLSFWDRHYPILLSVKSGYAYLAISQDDLSIVQGEEPEYEEASKVANSLAELMRMIVSNDQSLSRWL